MILNFFYSRASFDVRRSIFDLFYEKLPHDCGSSIHSGSAGISEFSLTQQFYTLPINIFYLAHIDAQHRNVCVCVGFLTVAQ